MSHSLLAACVRGVAFAEFTAQIAARIAIHGFEIASGATAIGASRLILRNHGDWCMVLGTDVREMWAGDGEWAAFLSEAFAIPALALAIWDGEGVITARRFEAGAEAARLELPRQVRRSKASPPSASAAVFTPWLPAAKVPSRAAPRITMPSQNAGDDNEFAALGPTLEDTSAAIAAAIALPEPWLRPAALELGSGDTVIAFRKSGTRSGLPLLPNATSLKPENAAQYSQCYHGRRYAVGALAFEGIDSLEPAATLFSKLLRTFCPRDGLDVRARRGTSMQHFPNQFKPTSQLSLTQLMRGGSLVFDSSGLPTFWIESTSNGAHLSAGFCLVKTGDDERDGNIVNALRMVIETAVTIDGCIAAFLTAQGESSGFGDDSLPYEHLVGTQEQHRDLHWQRCHVRSPGWCVLVPRGAAERLPKTWPASLICKTVPAGLLVSHRSETPYLMGSNAEMEHYLLPVVATATRTGEG
jgi:hypothetical protein